jgi:hypothetical protein
VSYASSCSLGISSNLCRASPHCNRKIVWNDIYCSKPGSVTFVLDSTQESKIKLCATSFEEFLAHFYFTGWAGLVECFDDSDSDRADVDDSDSDAEADVDDGMPTVTDPASAPLLEFLANVYSEKGRSRFKM